MKVQFREAQTKPTTVRLQPGDVALVMRKEPRRPLNTHCFFFNNPPQQTEEVSIGFGAKGQIRRNHSPTYRVSEWR